MDIELDDEENFCAGAGFVGVKLSADLVEALIFKALSVGWMDDVFEQVVLKHLQSSLETVKHNDDGSMQDVITALETVIKFYR